MKFALLNKLCPRDAMDQPFDILQKARSISHSPVGNREVFPQDFTPRALPTYMKIINIIEVFDC